MRTGYASAIRFHIFGGCRTFHAFHAFSGILRSMGRLQVAHMSGEEEGEREWLTLERPGQEVSRVGADSDVPTVAGPDPAGFVTFILNSSYPS